MKQVGFVQEFANPRKKIEIYGFSVVVGLGSGVVVVGYRAAITFLEGLRGEALGWVGTSVARAAVWAALAAIAGLAVAHLVKKAPYIKGSGIPQVKASLMRRIRQSWKLELPFKFLGGSLALGVGFSLGREGPSIQLGALAGEAVCDIAGRVDYKRYLVTAGAAAGISAAFNAPLAGVLFCVEELHKNVSPTMLTSSLIASFSANAVMWAAFGNAPVFGIAVPSLLPLSIFFPVILLIGLTAGAAGSLFNRGLLAFQSAYRGVCASQTLRLLSAFAAVAGVAMVAPALTGGGDRLIHAVGGGELGSRTLAWLLVGKVVFTLFCYASGAPGGIFLPMLAIGALLGGLAERLLVGWGLPSGYLPNYVLIGMVGFFTAVVRAPITGAILITEMAGSLSHFPAFILVSVIASLMAGALKTRPIYDSLLSLIAPEPGHRDSSRPTILYIPVLEGSILETCSKAQESLPAGCILASVERGEDDIFPRDDLDIQPGDVLRVIVERGKAHDLKERLLGLGQAPAGDHEAAGYGSEYSD